MKSLNVQAFGLSLAAFAALSMLVMALLAMAGFYTNAWEIMMEMHYFADLSFGGVIGGMLEAAVWSYISGVIIALLYNRLR